MKTFCPRCNSEVILSPECGTMCDGCGLALGFRVDYDSPRYIGAEPEPFIGDIAGAGF